MRRLLWFTLGFGAACGFCAYGKVPGLLILPALVLLAAVFAGDTRRNKLILSAMGILFGFFWFSRFEAQTLQPVYALDGITMETDIRCVSFPEETDYGYRAEGTIQINDRNYTVMCYLDHGEKIQPGNVLSGPFHLKVTAPGGIKESTYYQGEGIFLLAYQRDEITISEGESSWRDTPAKLRHKILGILEDTLPPDTSMFGKALLLGDTSDLDYETKTDFTVSGIRHIVAVSGLHVSILFSLLHTVSFRRRSLSALLAFPTLLLFAAMTGFTPSVSRACIMSGLMMVSLLLNREYDKETALAFAGLILLLVNPLVIASVSYQLSFASVAGIFLFSSGIRRWILSRLPKKRTGMVVRYLAGSASVTLGATIMTVPLCALYFGTVSLAAVVTNLLVLWVVSVVFYGLIALCLLSGIWHFGAMVLGKVLSVLIRYILVAAKMVAAFPLSAVYTQSPYIAAWLVFVYLLLGCFLLSKNRKPMMLSCCAVLGLCIALLASWTEPMMDDVRFTVLDVGQGQCLLLQSQGKTYMVDCGGSSDSMAADLAAETLLSQGISRLDALILTHYDRDHTGGAEYLLSRIDTGVLILPPVHSEHAFRAEEILYGAEDLLLSSGNTEIRVFSSPISGDDNENSLCVLFDTEKCDILITGDRDGFGERMLLRKITDLDIDVLVAGHHGSKYATCEELLTAVRPEIVCISAGRNNSFGHPAPELLQRLDHYGCSVYRTDLQGNIIIRR